MPIFQQQSTRRATTVELCHLHAIVFAEMVLVKSEPQKASNTVFTLHEGTKVFVLETLDNWRKIQLTDGTEGWIEKTAIKEVK